MKRWFYSAALALVAHAAAGGQPAQPLTTQPVIVPTGRTVVAHVIALDAPIIYNRFGSFNPFSMVYALEGDVRRVPAGTVWNVQGGQERWGRAQGELSCGGYTWRYRDGLRPRPLTLRGNVGDTLEVHFSNRLMLNAPRLSGAASLQGNCRGRGPYSKLLQQKGEMAEAAQPAADWPRTRNANLFIPGVTVKGVPDGKYTGALKARMERVCRGVESLAPGEDVVCLFSLERPGTHLFSSTGAPGGGQGDGGSLVQGLFGALNVERRDSRYYRSQVSAGELKAAWTPLPGGGRAKLDYERLNLLRPLGGQRYELVHADLNAIILEPAPTSEEIHVTVKDIADYRKQHPKEAEKDARAKLHDQALKYALEVHRKNPAFREFTAVFHDELKTFYADPFMELGVNPQLTGVKDGFALNYGASGMGSILLANRQGIGPSRNCVECLYEEFFLQSWANGDPALLERYGNDPSNVFHSYLNDRVAFRNLHAGPKETHVFHLHAHQWLSATDEDRGSYLDSQTIAPMQGHSYGIYAGGLKIYGQGDHEQTKGGGNRNRTVGDSIFHCHLYPHFAQGMWALWRTHDTLEDGTRTLPDGQRGSGLSIAPEAAAAPRPGTDPHTGVNRGGTPVPAVVPLPEQALPPAPTYGDRGMPGYPFYVPGEAGHRAPQPPLDLANDAGLGRHVVVSGRRETHDGHGAYAQGGAAAAHDEHAMHGGHGSATQQVGRALALADFTAELRDLNLKLLPLGGTPLEKRAMQFHSGEFGRTPLAGGGYGVIRDAQTGQAVTGNASPYTDGYPSRSPEGKEMPFTVNGSPPQPGAPFADPCGAPRPRLDGQFQSFRPDPGMIGKRRYDVSAIQLNLVVNKEGWHDPQGRINVLSADLNVREEGRAMFMPTAQKQRYFVLATKKPAQRSAAEQQEFQKLTALYFQHAGQKEGRATTQAEPFFFRAQSGECITYYHSNRIPMNLERDDFQMRTPTDTIGQHIHLVKFDVTSSDGSGNGFNYEDGTLAPDAVLERKCAYNEYLYRHYRRIYFKDRSTVYCGQPGVDPKRNFKRDFPAFGTTQFAQLPVQTTVQRWFADPIVTIGLVPATPTVGMPGMWHPTPDNIKKDRTLRTVFTHDHFAPSSIQQHGFYSALLIMPPIAPGSEATSWARPDGSPLADPQGQAVGTSAIVRNAVGTLYRQRPDHTWYATLQGAQRDLTQRDHREFALAVADFALLYEPRPTSVAMKLGTIKEAQATLSRSHGLDRLVAEAVLARDHPAIYDHLKRQGVITGNAHTLSSADVQDLKADLLHWRTVLGGRPVDPPQRPEAISTAHHNPFLVNYRQEPLPLRLGVNTHDPLDTRCGQDFISSSAPGPYFSARRIRFDSSGSVNAPNEGAAGDPARVFLTRQHGDPCTPMLEAFEGEAVQFRLVQGAQEVQHVFTVEGLSWERLPDYEVYADSQPGLAMPDRQAARGQGDWPFHVDWVRDNPLGKVNSQEIGISEHFETVLPYLANIEEADRAVDYLYHFGTQDALWNGAWGLIRVNNGLNVLDLQDCTNPYDLPGTFGLAQTKQQKETIMRVWPQRTPPILAEGDTVRAYLQGVAQAPELARLRPNLNIDCRTLAQTGRLQPVDLASQGNAQLSQTEVERVYPRDAARYFLPDATLTPAQFERHYQGNCPNIGSPTRILRFAAVATRVNLFRENGQGLTYLAADRFAQAITDPDALIILPLPEEFLPSLNDDQGVYSATYEKVMTYLRAQYASPGVPLQPFVLRATAGDCVDLYVYNALTDPSARQQERLPDGQGDALMPRIVPLNVDPDPQHPEVQQLLPSALLNLHVPQVALSPRYLQGILNAGINPSAEQEGTTREAADLYATPPRLNEPLSAYRVLFYAGEVTLERQGADFKLRARPYNFGPLPLRAYSDVIGQGTHGLYGMVIIEPQGSLVMPATPAPGNPRGLRDGAVPPREWHMQGLNAFICVVSAPDCRQNTTVEHLTLANKSVREVYRGFNEFVVTYQDGLNLHYAEQPVRDCFVCDDSYDLGDRAFNYATAPYWARLLNHPANAALRADLRYWNGSANLNRAAFPPNFFTPQFAPVPSLFSAVEGQDVRLRVMQVDGRARQHAFITSGYGYASLLPNYGASSSALVAPGLSFTAQLQRGEGAGRLGVAPGCTLYRDGPEMFAGAGMWGLLEVRSVQQPDASYCR